MISTINLPKLLKANSNLIKELQNANAEGKPIRLGIDLSGNGGQALWINEID